MSWMVPLPSIKSMTYLVVLKQILQMDTLPDIHRLIYMYLNEKLSGTFWDMGDHAQVTSIACRIFMPVSPYHARVYICMIDH